MLSQFGTILSSICGIFCSSKFIVAQAIETMKLHSSCPDKYGFEYLWTLGRRESNQKEFQDLIGSNTVSDILLEKES